MPVGMAGAAGSAEVPVRLNALGKEWKFSGDVPLVVAELERLCLEWMRSRVKAALEVFGEDRNTPGTVEHLLAEKAYTEFLAARDKGDHLPGGEQYAKWAQTPGGRLAVLVASLRLHHPDVTTEDVTQLVLAEPEQCRLVLLELGNRLRAFSERVLDAQEKIDPAAAKAARAKVQEIVAAMASSGSPG